MNRGRTTVYAIEAMGYTRGRILHACEHLGIVLQTGFIGSKNTRAKSKQRWRYIDSRLDELLAFLAKTPDGKKLFSPSNAQRTPPERWGTGTKPPCCRACSTTDRPHRSNGWCVACAPKMEQRVRRERAKAGAA